MALKLYFVPQTRSTRPRWLLEELGVAYDLHRLDPRKGETRAPDYLEVHPLGHVPALSDGDTTIIESAAIIMYLADRYGAGRLAPTLQSPERGEYYQWIMLSHATLEPALQPIHDSRQGRSVDGTALINAKKRVHDILSAIDSKLAGRPFAVGTAFTAADIVLAGAVGWALLLGQGHDFPRLQAYVARHMARPAAKKAREA